MFVSIEGTYREWLAVVGEFSGTFAAATPAFFGDVAAGTSAFVTGPRFTARPLRGVGAFGQLLAGLGQSGGDHDGYVAIGIQPGAGVDVMVHRHVSVRLAADRRLLLGVGAASGAHTSFQIFRAGLVLKL
jgi:hypothetical protein